MGIIRKIIESPSYDRWLYLEFNEDNNNLVGLNYMHGTTELKHFVDEYAKNDSKLMQFYTLCLKWGMLILQNTLDEYQLIQSINDVISFYNNIEEDMIFPGIINKI